MFKWLFDFSIIYDILLLVIILILLIIFIRSTTFRYILFTCIGVLYIFVTFLAGIEINKYYSASGGVYGVISSVIKPDIKVNEMTFKLNNLVLKSTAEENKYDLTIVKNEALELSKNTSYIILVNDTPTNIINSSIDFVDVNYTYVFYDDNYSELIKDTLNIKLVFYKQSTRLNITTTGGAKAVNYWNDYFNNNGFKIEIKPVKDIPINEDDVLENFNCVKFIVDNEEFKHFDLLKGKTLNENVIPPTKDGYIFKGWSLNNVDIIDNLSDVQINDDTTFYAVYEIEKCLVSFYDVDGITLLGTRLVDYGTIIDDDDIEFLISGSYRWGYLSGDGENTFGGIFVGGNVSLKMYKHSHIA